ncbi:hypothetical protein [Vibrio diabolicus]|uniref:hypothetical protein n=1 Tax=Vibrio diabolicus TaxID=50719 RepID=UPI0029437112|nr:hypothetical protein [Vibrio diabolicus]
MMTLTTVSERLSSTQSRIFWRVGTQRKGILDVTLDFENDDSALLCELCAIRHLLIESQVFGRAPGTGKGYKLVVSKGAIKKLARGRSDKKYAQKFAAFLQSRLAGVQIEVSTKTEYMAVIEAEAPEHLLAERKHYAGTFDAIETPAMGTVLVTAHAVSRYSERISSGKPKAPWLSLVKRLQNPELRIYPLLERERRRKAKKYGTADNVEEWGHPSSEFHFLILNDQGTRTLVTAYER